MANVIRAAFLDFTAQAKVISCLSRGMTILLLMG